MRGITERAQGFFDVCGGDGRQQAVGEPRRARGEGGGIVAAFADGKRGLMRESIFSARDSRRKGAPPLPLFCWWRRCLRDRRRRICHGGRGGEYGRQRGAGMDSKSGGGGEREIGAGQDGQRAGGVCGLLGGEQWGGGGGQAGGDVAAEFIGGGARGKAFPLPLARAGN